MVQPKTYEPNSNGLNKFQKVFYEYGCYHNDIKNIIVHMIFVPPITFTLLKILEFYSLNSWGLELNIPGIVLMSGSAIFWISVDPLLGFLTVSQYVIMDCLTRGFDFSCHGFTHIQVLFAIQAICWIFQILSHKVFEGRKPALTDNILQVFNAPVFINIELFYFMLGYKSDQINEAKGRIEVTIEQLNKNKNK